MIYVLKKDQQINLQSLHFRFIFFYWTVLLLLLCELEFKKAKDIVVLHKALVCVLRDEH
jgi:hypothetical protein